jgi:multidrug efflux system membrane fusion protein
MALKQPTGKPAFSWWHRLTGLSKIIIAVVIIGLLAWWWYSHGKDTKEHKPQPLVTLAPVVHKDVPVTLDGLGTVQAYNTVTVRTQVDGQLIEVLFKEGQEVHKGDVLAKIDPRTYQALYDQSAANKAKDEATLANAKVDLGRYIKLGDSVSQQTVDTQRALVRQLEATIQADDAALSSAATTLSYTIITSLIDGRTGIRQVDVGNVVHASDANGVVVITQLKPISVIFSLPQQTLEEINAQLALQPKLQVQALASDNHTLIDTGALELIDNQIDQTTGTIKLKATFPNDKAMLWPGGFVNVQLLVTTRKDAMVIPTVAVQRGPQNVSYVFVYKPDDSTVEMRTVKVGMTAGQDTVIDDGLKDGEQVVTDGMAKLQDGSKVKLPGAEDTPDEAGDTKKKHDHAKE